MIDLIPPVAVAAFPLFELAQLLVLLVDSVSVTTLPSPAAHRVCPLELTRIRVTKEVVLGLCKA